jgi:hypothetical protein
MTARKRRKTVPLPMMMSDLMMASWDNRAPHAASRAEQVLIGRIPAHVSREGHGGCNLDLD